MDSSIEDDSSRDSNITTDDSYCTQYEYKINKEKEKSNVNVVKKIFNRELYGRFAKNPRARTEKIYEKIPETGTHLLSEILPEEDTYAFHHIYMGFTICGQFLLSYTWTEEEDVQSTGVPIDFLNYYICVWCYAPGHRLKMVSKQKIFRHYRPQEFLDVTFSQWPTDRNRIVAYGVNLAHPSDAYITILFLPTLQKCEACLLSKCEDELNNHSPCLKHSVTIDFVLTTPFPVYNPVMYLTYPEHIVINTGHYLHVINVTYVTPKISSFSPVDKEDNIKSSYQFQYVNQAFSDSFSDFSENSEEFSTKSNVVEAILQDFSDQESSECSKPFHELNISCEPLNVTGKSYYNTNNYLLINAHSSNNPSTKTAEKQKIDKKIADKTYEFTEDNEKCEKLSSFRKKRLADKKYEFSEDNCENIVPFQLLRQERRFLLRNQNRLIRSPEYFISSRNQGMRSPRSPRSPMLSPGTRPSSGPGSPRNIYCPTLRLSPGTYQKDSTRRYGFYSPSYVDNDCSDNDFKIVLRQTVPKYMEGDIKGPCNNFGLLIIDGKRAEEKPRWIKKVVKRFCSLDFETASLISDVQGRDEDLGIDLPTLVCTANNNQIDPVPSRINDELIGPHLKLIQKTFDSEQFCQRRAEKICAETKLKFTHCEDYDIKIQHICPLSGDIICTADLKIGAVQDPQNYHQSKIYTTSCIFVWNMVTDSYNLMESKDSDGNDIKLVATQQRTRTNEEWASSIRLGELPDICCKKIRYMSHNNMKKSLKYLRDSENYIQISMDRFQHGFDLDDTSSIDFNYSFSDLSDIENI